jgi:hypothetical protein
MPEGKQPEPKRGEPIYLACMDAVVNLGCSVDMPVVRQMIAAQGRDTALNTLTNQVMVVVVKNMKSKIRELLETAVLP